MSADDRTQRRSLRRCIRRITHQRLDYKHPQDGQCSAKRSRSPAETNTSPTSQLGLANTYPLSIHKSGWLNVDEYHPGTIASKPDSAIRAWATDCSRHYLISNTAGLRSPLTPPAQTSYTLDVHRPGADLQASIDTLDSGSPSQKEVSTRVTPESVCTTRRESTGWLKGSRSRWPIPRMGFERGPPQLAPSPSLPAMMDIEHFRSFCVLDGAREGCPITSVSRDLRPVLDIGEEFTDRTRRVQGPDIDVCAGADASGNPVVHLVVYCPLVKSHSGERRFILACLLDITTIVLTVPFVPDLDATSGQSVLDDEIQTPTTFTPVERPWYGLSTGDLLGGCSIADELQAPKLSTEEDIWLDIATEETRRTQSIGSVSGTSYVSSTTPSTSSKHVETALDQLLETVQRLYSGFVVLGKSPLDEQTYEICYVSYSIHASHEYAEGQLSETFWRDQQTIERHLALDRPFQVNVHWGTKGEARRLYCAPLLGRSNITWVCFLVDDHEFASLPTW